MGRREIWEDEDGEGCCLAGPEGDGFRRLLSAKARLVHTFSAGSHYDAMVAYNRFLGREFYATTVHPSDMEPYPPPGRCPRCKFKTMAGDGGFEICPVCFWEDDGQDEHDADEVREGANGTLSLREAQRNYLDFGASDARFIKSVRPPLPDEI